MRPDALLTQDSLLATRTSFVKEEGAASIGKNSPKKWIVRTAADSLLLLHSIILGSHGRDGLLTLVLDR